LSAAFENLRLPGSLTGVFANSFDWTPPDHTKKVEFLNPKGTAAFAIDYDSIRAMQYEETGQPQYVAAVLLSPAFLLTHSKKHYPTIEYKDQAGEAHSVIVRLNKRNARQAVEAATAQTNKSVEQIEEK